MWKKLFFVSLFCALGILSVFVWYQVFIANTLYFSKLVTPVAQISEDKTHTISPTPTPQSNMDMNTIEAIVQESLTDTSGTYSVYIKDLTNNQTYGVNEHRTFLTGSIYKLWIMAETYKQIKDNILTHDQILSQDIAVLNRKFQIDPAYAEQTSGGITASIDEALHKMITISHNYAAMLLTEKVLLSNVAKLLTEYDMTESRIGNSVSLPITTAYDTAVLLEAIYKGTMIDEQSSQYMMELLKAQELNGKLPKYLPDGTIIAHKTGELDQFSHDAGIVFTDQGDYIIVVLTETNNPQQANEIIARLSEKIYQHIST